MASIGNEVCARQTQVESEMCALRSVVNELAGSIESIHSRLHMVLLEDQPNNRKDGGTAAPCPVEDPLAPLAGMLRSLRKELETIYQKNESVIRRIEV
jgi:hypothetical protein